MIERQVQAVNVLAGSRKQLEKRKQELKYKQSVLKDEISALAKQTTAL
jgi:UDP-N-acetylenolpyruvoylglucosamine reductase